MTSNDAAISNETYIRYHQNNNSENSKNRKITNHKYWNIKVGDKEDGNKASPVENKILLNHLSFDFDGWILFIDCGFLFVKVHLSLFLILIKRVNFTLRFYLTLRHCSQ